MSGVPGETPCAVCGDGPVAPALICADCGDVYFTKTYCARCGARTTWLPSEFIAAANLDLPAERAAGRAIRFDDGCPSCRPEAAKYTRRVFEVTGLWPTATNMV